MTLVETEVRDSILVITLNRPQARNAINAQITQELTQAIRQLEESPDLRAAVLTATGPVFCAGADLKEVQAGRFDELTTADGGFAGFTRLERTKPVIAVLTGDAIAGGMEIAIACDLIVAEEGVRMGIPEVQRSLVAVGGAVARLPQLIGEKAALELAMIGDLHPVDRFLALGLVNAVVATGEGVSAGVAFAERIAANPPLAVQAARKSIVDVRDEDFHARWAYAETMLEDVQRSEDFKEGSAAFIEKRPPVWTGR